MDKIWDRKAFEVGGHWPLWRRWKTRMTMQNRQKSNDKKREKNGMKITKSFVIFYVIWLIKGVRVCQHIEKQ